MKTELSLMTEERLQAITEHLKNEGRAQIAPLAREFGVSEMTIRRDLDELAALGIARRVRGGAVAVGPIPFAERHRRQARAKARIAEKLVAVLPDVGTVAFDASSTIHRLATTIEGARDLTIVTNGLDTFEALRGKPGITPILAGGVLEPRTGSLVGAVACRVAQDFLFDMFVCSAAAVHGELGSSETSLEEAEVKRAMGSTAKEIVLGADHAKLGARAQARVFPFEKISLFVTDLEPSDSRLSAFRGQTKLK